MSVLVLSHLNTAVLASVLCKSNTNSDLMELFIKKIKKELELGVKLHAIDKKLERQIVKLDYVKCFESENFEFLNAILSGAMVEASKQTKTPVEYKTYKSGVAKIYSEAKKIAKDVKFIDFFAMINFFEYQICEIEDYENTLAYKLFKDAKLNGFYLFDGETTKAKYYM